MRVSDVGKIFAGVEREITRDVAKVLTGTAAKLRDEVTLEIGRVFDRPTPWTVKSVFYRGASVDRGRMYAQVWFKDFAAKGNAAADYLKPQVFGGIRAAKRMEKALQRAGILPPGMFVVPGRDAKLDAYGNMSRGQIVQILAYFKGLHDSTAWMTDKRKANLAKDKVSRKTGQVTKGFKYAVLHQRHGKLLPGVYKRLRYGDQWVTRPIMIFVRTPAYRIRLPFFEIGERVVRRELAGFRSATRAGGGRLAA